MTCKFCGGKRFIGHMVERHDVIVDENGNYEDDVECYDSENPYGPFTCCGCGAEYAELEDEPRVTEKPFSDKTEQTVLDMCSKLNEMALTSPFLLEMAWAVQKMTAEETYTFEQAYVVAMALFHPNGVLCGRQQHIMPVDYLVDGLTFLPAGILPQNIVDHVFMGRTAFNHLVIDFKIWKEAVYEGNHKKADFHREGIYRRINEAFISKDAQDRIEAAKKRYNETGFIWTK